MCFPEACCSHRKYHLTFQTDPFRSVYKLSEEERELSRNQTIPSLLQLLDLAKEHDISVLFDLYNLDTENDTEDIVDTIWRSGIDQSLVSLLLFLLIKILND